jgi:hypothetical protein
MISLANPQQQPHLRHQTNNPPDAHHGLPKSPFDMPSGGPVQCDTAACKQQPLDPNNQQPAASSQQRNTELTARSWSWPHFSGTQPASQCRAAIIGWPVAPRPSFPSQSERCGRFGRRFKGAGGPVPVYPVVLFGLGSLGRARGGWGEDGESAPAWVHRSEPVGVVGVGPGGRGCSAVRE